MAGRTEIMEIAPGRFVVHTRGLRELSRALSDLKDKKIPREFSRRMKMGAGRIADVARHEAPSRSGDFAASIDIVGGRGGVFLRSTDPGAGVIEFAEADHHGQALTEAWGPAPRALFKAIEMELPDLATALEAILEDMAAAVLSQSFNTPD